MERVGLKSVLKLQMTSYSDNVYDVTIFFVFFLKFLAYTLSLPSFIVVRHQIVKLKWGASPPVHYRGNPDPVQNRLKVSNKQLNQKHFCYQIINIVV